MRFAAICTEQIAFFAEGFRSLVFIPLCFLLSCFRLVYLVAKKTSSKILGKHAVESLENSKHGVSFCSVYVFVGRCHGQRHL